MTRNLLMLLMFNLVLGCSFNATPSLYYWKGYQGTVYEQLESNTSDPVKQTIALEHIVIQANAQGKSVPPGLYANLGMLYAEVGRFSEAKASFEKEKNLFPESTTYMTFLMSNLERKGSRHD